MVHFRLSELSKSTTFFGRALKKNLQNPNILLQKKARLFKCLARHQSEPTFGLKESNDCDAASRFIVAKLLVEEQALDFGF